MAGSTGSRPPPCAITSGTTTRASGSSEPRSWPETPARCSRHRRPASLGFHSRLKRRVDQPPGDIVRRRRLAACVRRQFQLAGKCPCRCTESNMPWSELTNQRAAGQRRWPCPDRWGSLSRKPCPAARFGDRRRTVPCDGEIFTVAAATIVVPARPDQPRYIEGVSSSAIVMA